MSKYRIEAEFKDWTIDELQVAITTLEYDLRGSWAEAYEDRIQELGRLCESMVHKFERADKQTFYDLELSDAGKTQRVVDWLELNTVCDDWHWFHREFAKDYS
jgi:hypothetical protein